MDERQGNGCGSGVGSVHSRWERDVLSWCVFVEENILNTVEKCLLRCVIACLDNVAFGEGAARRRSGLVGVWWFKVSGFEMQGVLGG
jgi:hypothetical protein